MMPRSGPRRRCSERSALHDVGVAVAHVDDERQIAATGERHVAIEVILLQVERREVPVAVETRLANGDDFGLIDQPFDLGPIVGAALGDVIRLETDGGVDPVVRRGDFDALAAGGDGGADGDDRGHAGGLRPFDHEVAIIVEFFLIKVGVGIEQFHAECQWLTTRLRLAVGNCQRAPLQAAPELERSH
jgi:hypothetical protein